MGLLQMFTFYKHSILNQNWEINTDHCLIYGVHSNVTNWSTHYPVLVQDSMQDPIQSLVVVPL